jgi:hypothetical protein
MVDVAVVEQLYLSQDALSREPESLGDCTAPSVLGSAAGLYAIEFQLQQCMVHQGLARSSHDPFALVFCREPIADGGAAVGAADVVETYAAGQFASMKDPCPEAVAV